MWYNSNRVGHISVRQILVSNPESKPKIWTKLNCRWNLKAIHPICDCADTAVRNEPVTHPLQLSPSWLFGVLSRDVPRLLNPGGMSSHSSKRIPLPREKDPAAHWMHSWEDISKNSPAPQENAVKDRFNHLHDEKISSGHLDILWTCASKPRPS